MSDTAKRMWSKNDITSMVGEDYIPIKQIDYGAFIIPQIGYNKEIYWIGSDTNLTGTSLAQRTPEGRLRAENPKDEYDLVNLRSLKTIFGNQSLVGTGNIDLYEHDITITGTNLKAYFTIYSSVNTKIDSLNDLKAVIKKDKFTKSCTGHVGSKTVEAITELNLILADGTTELLTNVTFDDDLTTI